MKIRGGILTISSAAAEQSHVSDKVVLPTKLMGIVSPEEQLFEMVRCSDDWVRRDLTKNAELELYQEVTSRKLTPGSPRFKALFALTRHYYH